MATSPHNLVTLLLLARQNRRVIRLALVNSQSLTLTLRAIAADALSGETVVGRETGVIVPYSSIDALEMGDESQRDAIGGASPVRFRELLENARVLSHKLVVHTRSLTLAGRASDVGDDYLALVAPERPHQVVALGSILWVQVIPG
jgi:hypothetical protein